MKLKEGILINKIEDEYILVDVGTIKPAFNGMIKLNETSKEIIELLKNEIKEEDIVQKLADKYNAPIKEISKDVKGVIAELKKAHLLK